MNSAVRTVVPHRLVREQGDTWDRPLSGLRTTRQKMSRGHVPYPAGRAGMWEGLKGGCLPTRQYSRSGSRNHGQSLRLQTSLPVAILARDGDGQPEPAPVTRWSTRPLDDERLRRNRYGRYRKKRQRQAGATEEGQAYPEGEATAEEGQEEVVAPELRRHPTTTCTVSAGCILWWDGGGTGTRTPDTWIMIPLL